MRLQDSITTALRLSDEHKNALSRLGVKTIRDLLFYFPFRYDMGGGESTVAGLQLGQEVSIIGTLERLEAKKSWKSRIPIAEGYLRDQTGRIKLRFFNQPYIAKMYANDTLVKATGKVTGSAGKEYLANPQLERVSPTEAGLFSKQTAPEKSLAREEFREDGIARRETRGLFSGAVCDLPRGRAALLRSGSVMR